MKTFATLFLNAVLVFVTGCGTLTGDYLLAGHKSIVGSLTFSSDGKTLASGSWDGTMRLWDVENRVSEHVFDLDVYRVYSVAFSPDDQLVACSGLDKDRLHNGSWGTKGFFSAWNRYSKRCVAGQTNAQHDIVTVTFLPDSRSVLLVSPCDTRVLDVYETNVTETFSVTSERDFFESRGTVSSNGIMAVAGVFSNDKPGVRLCDPSVVLWTRKGAKTHRFLFAHKDGIDSVCFSHSGDMLVTCEQSGGSSLSLWEVGTGRMLYSLQPEHGELGLRCVFTANDKLLLVTRGQYVEVLETKTGKILGLLGGRLLGRHPDTVLAITVSKDGRWIATSARNRVYLWRTDHLQSFVSVL